MRQNTRDLIAQSAASVVESLEGRTLLSAYFVSASGNDAGAGTAADPWKTLQYAANKVKAGDNVTVRAGTYAGFHLTADGTASQRITFTAENGVIINQKNSKTADGINLEGADYVTVQGFQVLNTTGTITRAGIRSVTNTGAIIRNNTADNNGRWGIFTAFSENILIEGNTTTRSQQEHGIYFSNSADNAVIRGNTSWGNRACGIHLNGDASEGGDGVLSNLLVENNVIYDNGIGGGSAINGDGVQNSIIRNNVMYNNHSNAISLYRIDGGAASTGNLIVNNTISVAADGRWAINITDGAKNNRVFNNILLNNHSYRGGLSVSADSLSGLVSDNNAGIGRFSSNGGGSVQTLAQWQSATGQDAHSVVAMSSQLFVNAAGNDYHLSSSSPAVNKGTSAHAPTTDAKGRARNGAVDIGAYEFGGTVTTPAPTPTPVPPPVTQPPVTPPPVSQPAPTKPTTPTVPTAPTVPSTGPAALENDPWIAGKKALVVRGTAGNDTIHVKRASSTSVVVTVNDGPAQTFALAGFGRIFAYGLAGNDRIVVSVDVSTPAYIDGGLGNDTLFGGSGNDVVLGGEGADEVLGRDGNDVVVGGAGVDIVNGGAGHNFLIREGSAAGSTLTTVAARWNSAAGFSSRVAAVRTVNLTALKPTGTPLDQVVGSVRSNYIV